jgi:ribosomal protein L20
MKTQEEIEQLADKFATSIYGFRNENHNSYLECKRNCIEFYTQCQEDMADKKYTEEDMLKLWNTVMVAMTNKNPIFFKDYINSLTK